MKLSLRLLPLFILLFASFRAEAAERKETAQPSLELTPVRLVLGMPKEQVITLLTEYYDLAPWKGGDVPDTWGVGEKNGIHFVVGILAFQNGSLTRAARFWKHEDTDFSVVRTLSNLIGLLRDEGFEDCKISTRKEPQPDSEHDAIVINCGPKGIVVSADAYHHGGKDLQTVEISEELEVAASKRR